MKIRGNFQNLEMCGIDQWSYLSRCRAPKTWHLRKKGEHRGLFESLEAQDAL
jgi:hypothetical protein